ncbi:MAG: inovirus-type Gp2 protein [Rhodocyclaceae bacterium]
MSKAPAGDQTSTPSPQGIGYAHADINRWIEGFEERFATPTEWPSFDDRAVTPDSPSLHAYPDGARIDLEILSRIEHFIDAVRAGDEAAFGPLVKRGASYRHEWRPLARQFFPSVLQLLGVERAGLYFAPKVSVFLKVCEALSIAQWAWSAPEQVCCGSVTVADLFNELVTRIREECRCPAFVRQSSRAAERSRRQTRLYKGYVKALFERRSRLIVIRLDLAYTNDGAARIALEDATRDLAHFFGNMRGKPSLFADLEGHIWKLECGELGAHHFHVILFFNNDHFQNDALRAEQIGQYWCEVITRGRGRFFNCNRSKYMRRFERQGLLGIGRIEHYEAEKRASLERIIEYLCKSEQQVKVKSGRGFRTMGRGVLPRTGARKLGRPRQL